MGEEPRVAVFAPHPVLTVTLEREGEGERIHFHAGGQGVWVAEMARTMGARATLCALVGGEVGDLLRPLLERTAGELQLIGTAGASGCYVTDRRTGQRELLGMRLADPPTRHELDELFSRTCAAAIACGTLVVTNPLPGEALPLEVYGDLVADARAAGVGTLVDLSTPRLDSALRGEPDLVKINDWELAAFIRGPVSEPAALLAAARMLCERGARNVIITRGEQPALVLGGERALLLSPPRFEHGFREGCGDAMMGALAAAWARGDGIERAALLGAAAGAANFLRRGIGHAAREVVDEIATKVALEDWDAARIA